MEEQALNMSSFYRSILEQDRASVVICNLNHEIIYMNPQAIRSYEKRGGEKLIGRSLMECHNAESAEKIQKVIEWCKEKISLSNAEITRKGKNWYITIDNCIITVNA